MESYGRRLKKLSDLMSYKKQLMLKHPSEIISADRIDDETNEEYDNESYLSDSRSGKFWSCDSKPDFRNDVLLDFSFSSCFEHDDSANQDLCADFLSEPSNDSIITCKNFEKALRKVRMKRPPCNEKYDKTYLTYEVTAKVEPDADFQERLNRILGRDGADVIKQSKGPRGSKPGRKIHPIRTHPVESTKENYNTNAPPRKVKKSTKPQERPLKKSIVSLHKAVQADPQNLQNVSLNSCSGMIKHESRRADHIDDILFAEWRQLEPEWTGFHIDEAIIKKQIFDSIFQKVLTQTVDEYKKTVKNTYEI